MNWLTECLKERNRQKALRIIRETAAMFGYNLSDLSDEEIEAGIERTGKVFASTGVTCDEAVAAFSTLGKALSQEQHS